MPAELSILTRFPCLLQECPKHFKYEWARGEHLAEVHSFGSSATPAMPSMQFESIQAPKKVVRVKCTYQTCTQEFESEHDMIQHKLDDPEHDYCPSCPQKNENGDILTDERGRP